MKNPIIFEDEHLLIANKPGGIAAVPERNEVREKSFLGQLEKSCGQLFVVHRIDKQTSGAICFAKNESTHRALNILFETRAITKQYLALVKGKMLQTEGTINQPLAENPSRPGTMKVDKNGKEAITSFVVEENFRHATLLKVKIHTGRMHQIRVHLKSIGYPLLIDEIYADTKAFFISSVIKNYKRNEEHEERPTMFRLTLHAASLGFEHPVTQQKLCVEAPLPKDFETLIKLLRKYDK